MRKQGRIEKLEEPEPLPTVMVVARQVVRPAGWVPPGITTQGARIQESAPTTDCTAIRTGMAMVMVGRCD